jgi:hypothetical protein
MTVELADWARAAETKMTSTPLSGNESLSKASVLRKFFWGAPKREVIKVTKVTKAVSRALTYHSPWSTHTAKYAVYSAQVTTSSSTDLHKGLRVMMKKDPPSHFDFEMIYVSLPATSSFTFAYHEYSSPKRSRMQEQQRSRAIRTQEAYSGDSKVYFPN